ncbi:RagB/SusD family nutrient uptake outer membrane protein [Algoriphagus aestuariicola]|uniref:RagB/SusD family nutrient uptake outer membrane protein n=1 Tax=Algoriphagus aestuariicola TaxID=1852016 RepID=A0ABS3BVF3_9BACT|nr:RagB/SusD family nutrient uptake outer membrane protein [Algoriphagus aestuariicola]MBN7803231.1 RagB/SusD family nutrient uptake outer membrane protein [Algoriphagus aestuariicola]
MKRTKSHIAKFILLSSLIAITSCADFLDESDKSNFTLDNYFTKPEHATSAVNSIYQSLQPIMSSGFGGGPWMMTEFATGLADTELGQAQNSLFVMNLDNTSDNGYGQTYWTSFYLGIANANVALAEIPGMNMDETAKNKLLGEARFLRAYYYFNLVQIFGRVPLITDPIDLSSENLYPDQAEPAAVYDQIVADLQEAEKSGLAWRDASGRVSMGAVKSLLSSVYLTMAGYPLQKGNEYYALAASKAKEVMDSSTFSLFDSYAALHNPSMKNLGENIFMAQFVAYILPSSWQVSIIPYNRGISNYSAETGGIFAQEAFVKSYEPGDKRAAEKEFYYTSYTLRSDRTKSLELGDYYIFKHFDELAQTSTTSSSMNWPILRYAEVLLIFAEASNEANGPNSDAYAAVNQIRSRAALAPLQNLSKEQLREAIWREKFFELSFENKTWFDMVRIRKGFNVTTRQFEDYVGHKFVYGPTVTERELLFPIPTAEVRNNPKLVQNPGY